MALDYNDATNNLNIIIKSFNEFISNYSENKENYHQSKMPLICLGQQLDAINNRTIPALRGQAEVVMWNL